MPPEKAAVVIPAHNRRDELIRCVNSVLRQDYGDFEVIIVDDASDPAVEPGWFNGGNLRIMRNPSHMNVSASRNRAVRGSGAEVIVLLDDDCWVGEKDWLSRHVEANRRFPRSLTGGRIISVSRRFPGKVRAMMGDNCTQFNFLQTMNLSFRKCVFDEIGGFNEEFAELEDLDFSQRAVRKGITLNYEETIVSYHKAIDSFTGIMRRQRQYGLWAVPVRKSRKYDGHQLLPPNLACSFLYCIPLSVAVSLWQVLNNIRRHPAIVLWLPVVWMYNFSYASGIVAFYRRKLRG